MKDVFFNSALNTKFAWIKNIETAARCSHISRDLSYKTTKNQNIISFALVLKQTRVAILEMGK